MYFKKILLAIVALGLVGMVVFAYYVNKVILQKILFWIILRLIYIHPERTIILTVDQLTPLFKDIETFDALVKQKKMTCM